MRGVCPTLPVLTSSGGHCCGRYASYWNASLYISVAGAKVWFHQALPGDPTEDLSHCRFTN